MSLGLSALRPRLRRARRVNVVIRYLSAEHRPIHPIATAEDQSSSTLAGD